MKLKLGIVLFLFTLIISACNKEKLIEPNEEALCENMLYFDSFEEMNTELENVMKMNYKERLAWEKSKGFTSIELEAERLYETIDPEQFKSVDEVKRFVESNSHLLKLVEDENGEYELETKLYEMPYRYFANKNGLFKVNDHFCIVYPEGVISIEKNILHDIVDLDFSSCLTKAEVNIVYQKSLRLKSFNETCRGAVVRADYGRERTRLLIDAGHERGQVFTMWEVRAYNKRLGIWYRAIRTISCSIDINIKYKNYRGEWRTKNTSYSNSGERTYVLNGLDWIDIIQQGTNVEITSYNCWGKQPNTIKAEAKCNVD